MQKPDGINLSLPTVRNYQKLPGPCLKKAAINKSQCNKTCNNKGKKVQSKWVEGSINLINHFKQGSLMKV